jgi:hypothetical protein
MKKGRGYYAPTLFDLTLLTCSSSELQSVYQLLLNPQ